MPRSGTAVFISDGNEEKYPKTSYCEQCKEDRGRIVKLVPYLENDIPSDKFRLCPNCAEIIPIFQALLDTQYVPKGTITDNPYESSLKVKVGREMRKTRTNHTEGIEQIEVPPIGGNIRDEFLEDVAKMKERPAVINYINDVVVEGSDSEIE